MGKQGTDCEASRMPGTVESDEGSHPRNSGASRMPATVESDISFHPKNHLASPLIRHVHVRMESQDLRDEQGVEEVHAPSHAGASMPRLLSHYQRDVLTFLFL